MTTITDSLREHGLGQHDLRMVEQDRIGAVDAIRRTNVGLMSQAQLKPVLDTYEPTFGPINENDVSLATPPIGGLNLDVSSTNPFHIEVLASGIDGLNDDNVAYLVDMGRDPEHGRPDLTGGGVELVSRVLTSASSFEIPVSYPGVYFVTQSIRWAGNLGIITHRESVTMPLDGLRGGVVPPPEPTTDAEPLDPSDHTYAEIRAHVTDNLLGPDGDPLNADALAEIQRIKDAEVDGKNRVRVVNWLDAIEGVI